MGKIFVVTEGEYDDYHILGVTTDRAVAERIVVLYTDDYGWYPPKIEEHDDTTAQDIANEKPGWCVDLWDDGRLQAHKQSSPYRPENYREIVTRLNNDHVLCIVPGETEEEAIEEAKKRRDEHDSNN